MAVFRVEKSNNFTVMSNFHLRDKRLTLKSKGLLSLMLSLPEDWDYTMSGLATINRDGLDCIRTALRELEECGYVKISRHRNDRGHFAESEYRIFEKPILEQPTLENPILDNPILENPTQLNTEVDNTQIINTDDIKYQSINQDGIDEMEQYRQIIYENIDYEATSAQYNKEQLDEIVEIMLECICSKKETLIVGQEEIPRELVKSRFLKIDSGHIEYIFWCLQRNTSKVRNIKAYLKAVIYNAPVTISNFYVAEVNHDLYGG